MQYLSEFEVLAQPIVPGAGIPPGGKVPFVAQGYFCLLSRLPDDDKGDVDVVLTFHPTPAFPASTGVLTTDPLIADFQDENGTTQLNLDFTNSISVPVSSGKTVLFGLQPNIANVGIFAPAGQFGVRGYVTIDVVQKGQARETYELAAAPEIRASFFTIDPANPVVDLDNTPDIAYCLPVRDGGRVTITKGKVAEKSSRRETVAVG
jgi:hypothetical protein